MSDKNILVVGLARSGCAVGALLRRHGARIIGFDDASEREVDNRWRSDDLEDLAATAFDELMTGGQRKALRIESIDGVAVSPGVPLDHPLLRELAGTVPVLAEMEWASRFFEGRIVAITGTNGKSTTTELTAHLARAVGWRAEALGNVGRPLSLVADTLGREALAVLEVSSFQLEAVASFSPDVSVVLNLAPDHLDRHGSLAAYYAAKRRLVEVLAPDGRFVTWTGCEEARSWATCSEPLLFGERSQGACVYRDEGRIWIAEAEIVEPLIDEDRLSLQSAPELLNTTAAVATMLPLAPDRTALAEGLCSFRGLRHRHRRVARLEQVDFVDDSKATNVAAVCAGLAGHRAEVVLIAGGRGKGEDYTPLREVMNAVKAVVLIGEEGPAIGEALAGTTRLERAATLSEAVAVAADLARPRGTVLLSPACASFDMFRTYHERGEAFARAALALGATEVEQV